MCCHLDRAADAVATDATAPPDSAAAAVDANGDAVDAYVDTEAEDLACANLAAIAPCGPASMDAMVCLENFLDLRRAIGIT